MNSVVLRSYENGKATYMYVMLAESHACYFTGSTITITSPTHQSVLHLGNFLTVLRAAPASINHPRHLHALWCSSVLYTWSLSPLLSAHLLHQSNSSPARPCTGTSAKIKTPLGSRSEASLLPKREILRNPIFTPSRQTGLSGAPLLLQRSQEEGARATPRRLAASRTPR